MSSDTPIHIIYEISSDPVFDAAAAASTAEQDVLGEVTIPADKIGRHSNIVLELLTDCTDTANAKSLRAKIDGNSFAALDAAGTAGGQFKKRLWSAGARNAWDTLPAERNDVGAVEGVLARKTYDFTADRTFTLTFQTAIAGEKMQLRHLRLYIENPATAPAPLTATESLDTIVDREVTWKLDAAAPVGRFVSGDYFAVGATVNAALPASFQQSGTYDSGEAFTGRWVHGLMVDYGRLGPGVTGADPSTTPQGWDGLPPAPSAGSPTEVGHDNALNKDPGATGAPISGVKTLSKAVSILTAPEADSRHKLANTSLLTLLDAVPPEGAFRRWAGAISKTPIFFASDIDWSVLPLVAKPASATLPTASALIAKLGPINTLVGQMLFSRGVNPDGVQSRYGGNMANDMLQAMFFTMTQGVSLEDRKAVAYKLIQIGLDLYDATEAGRRWSGPSFSFGGAHQWLKPTLVYAARLLRNAADVVERRKLLKWCDGTLNAIFGNDMTVFPIDRERIESNALESIQTRPQPQGWPDWSENATGYAAKPSNKGYGGVTAEIAYQGTNSYPYISAALVARMMGAERLWNNPRFFEWCDTWHNRWVRRNYDTDPYFYPYCYSFVRDYYPAYSPAYLDGTAPTLARREARGRYAWFEFDKALDLQAQPAPADVSVSVAGSAVSLGSVSTTASGTRSTGSTNTYLPVITVASASGVRIGQRAESPALEPDTFVVSVSGTTIGITSWVPATFSGQPVSFHDTFVWGRSLVAVLPTPLVSAAQAVTMGYTAPSSGYVRNLGGVAAPSIGSAASTNRTGELPPPPASKANAYSGPTAASRQYSGTAPLRAGAFRRLRGSLRFKVDGAIAPNDTLVSSSSGSTGSFRIYTATGSDVRILLGPASAPQQIRGPNALSLLTPDTLVTLHFFLDLDQTSQSAAKKLAVVWAGGGNNNVNVSSSVGTLPTVSDGDIASFLTGGLFTHATGSGSSPLNGSIQEFTLGWGDATLPLPADFTGPQFAHDADWGGHGEGPWGQNQLAYAGPLSEWNASLPNRGTYGALSLTPRRFVTFGDEDSGLLTPYVEQT
ncbi:hypothetical protein [Phenylobacterium sp.]|jgi:hypothetical protein|uniref:hypothetical protein n=1 Tax=Phenylobacterium sp. TaxID=1871053 RepID=UPI0035B299D0